MFIILQTSPGDRENAVHIMSRCAEKIVFSNGFVCGAIPQIL